MVNFLPTSLVGQYNGHQYTPKVGLTVRYAYRQQSEFQYVANAMESQPLRYGILGGAVHRSGPVSSGSTRYIGTRDPEIDEDPTIPSMLFAFSNKLTLLTVHPAMSANCTVYLTGTTLSGGGESVTTKIRYSDADLLSQGFDLAWLSTGADYESGYYLASHIKNFGDDHYSDEVYPLAPWCLNVQRLRHNNASPDDFFLITGSGTITTRYELTYRPAFFQNGKMLVAVSGSYVSQEIDADEAPVNADLDVYHWGDKFLLTNLTQFNDVTDFPTIVPGELLIGPDSPPVLMGFIAFFDLELGTHRTGDPDAAGVPTTGTHYRWYDPLRGTDTRPVSDMLFQITDAACRTYWEELVSIGGEIPGEATSTIFDEGAGDFEVPPRKHTLIAEGWGGGGGGAAGEAGGGNRAGSGGGSGGYFRIVLSVTPGDLIPYSVGAGGIGGTYDTDDATAGGATTISGGTYTAGGGGKGGFGGGQPGGTGGVATGGTTNTNGNAGAVNPADTTGGQGGNAPLGGTGGIGGIAAVQLAGNGTAPGSGGGGGGDNSSFGGGDTADGGDGAYGRVKFTY